MPIPRIERIVSTSRQEQSYPPSGSVLPRQAILDLLHGEPPLLADYLDLASQLQPQGFDLTLREVSAFDGPGQIGVSNDERVLPPAKPLATDPLGYFELGPGAYLATLNEVVNLPLDIMALGRPRSSLLRSGVTVGTAVWDAGYHGRSQCMLIVSNAAGFRVAKDARILQLVFFRLAGAAEEGYEGTYQGENL
ncbi:MAG: dUTP pyrophosphatase [Chloroflexi bacterium]|nr:MAG: dUTP pyrophosphatase [Chloroflexota bacterium]